MIETPVIEPASFRQGIYVLVSDIDLLNRLLIEIADPLNSFGVLNTVMISHVINHSSLETNP